MNDPTDNLYAAPAAEVPAPGPGEAARCYAESGKLIVPRGCEHELPVDVCVKCGQPAVRQVQRTLAWHHPYLFAFLICFLLPYIILAIIFSRRMKLEFGVCPKHLTASRGWLALSIVLFAAAAGVTIAFAAGGIKENIAQPCGLLAFTGAVAAALKARWALLRPLLIGDDHGIFTGAGEQVLSRFPSNWEMYRND